LDSNCIDFFRRDGRAWITVGTNKQQKQGNVSVMFTPLNIILFGVIALLGVGFYGLLITRNLIKVVLVLQILIKAVILALILAGKMSGNLGLGQSTAATVIVADTIVAVVGLALGVQVRRRFGTLDVPKISTLRG
jgi:NADH:ubiquinone oxidoreductase subunit K